MGRCHTRLSVSSTDSDDGVTIARVTREDFGDLLPLVRGYCNFYEVSPSDADLRSLFEAIVADPAGEGIQLLARGRGSGPLGFATLYWTWSTARAARIGVMNDLFVVPEARGQRIGERLIEACRDHCRARGATSLGWQTALDNERAQRDLTTASARRGSVGSYSLPVSAGPTKRRLT